MRRNGSHESNIDACYASNCSIVKGVNGGKCIFSRYKTSNLLVINSMRSHWKSPVLGTIVHKFSFLVSVSL